MALAGGLPVCGPNGNGISRSARAPMWGDSVAPMEPGGVAMISQSGNVAVNALGSRRGIRYHTVLSTGNQAVLDASQWLAAICERDGVRSVAMFLEEDGDGARLANALARCVERGVRVAVLKAGASEAAPERPLPTPAPSRATRGCSGPWLRKRAAPGQRIPTSSSSSPARWPSPAPGPAATAGSRSSPARAATRASPPTRPRGSTPGARARRGDKGAPRGPPAGGGDGRQPARLHGDDLGRDGPVRRSRSRSAPTRRSISCSSSTTIPRGWRRRRPPPGPRFEPGSLPARPKTEAATLVASTLPDLIDDAASGELARHGVPAVAGLRTALACAKALGSMPPTRIASGRSPPPRRKRTGPAVARPPRTPTAGWTRSRRRSCCEAPESRCPMAGWWRARTSARPRCTSSGGRWP